MGTGTKKARQMALCFEFTKRELLKVRPCRTLPSKQAQNLAGPLHNLARPPHAGPSCPAAAHLVGGVGHEAVAGVVAQRTEARVLHGARCCGRTREGVWVPARRRRPDAARGRDTRACGCTGAARDSAARKRGQVRPDELLGVAGAVVKRNEGAHVARQQGGVDDDEAEGASAVQREGQSEGAVASRRHRGRGHGRCGYPGTTRHGCK
jgi:hypothetical protein